MRLRLLAFAVAALALGASLTVPHLAGQSAAPTPLTLVTRDGRRLVPVTLVGNQEFVALDDLASLFQLSLREDSGTVTVSSRGRTIVLTSDQAFVSVAGRLVSLPAPPVRSGRRWLVPVEFVGRALASISDTRIDLRKPSHLLIVGDLRVPRVTLRYEPSGPGGRLTVDATPRTVAAVTQDRDRLLVRFDADALDLPLQPAISAPGLVLAQRVVEPATLVFDLGPRFTGFRSATQSVDASARLVIDLAATQTESAPAAPAAGPAPAPAPPPADVFASTSSSLRTIVIDPGHGAADEGAHGPGGTKEKDVALALARRLKAAFESTLGVRVLLTRDDDKVVGFDERSALANNNKADLFISIHADGALRPTASGASIITQAFDPEDVQRARAAIAPELLPAVGGGMRDIELVPWDLAQIRYVDDSAVLAGLVAEQFKERVPLAPLPVVREPVRVLATTNMPAILVNGGFLTNADQERWLTSADGPTAFAKAIVDAVLAFREQLDAKKAGAR